LGETAEPALLAAEGAARAGIEPVIGRLKGDHRMDMSRNKGDV